MKYNIKILVELFIWILLPIFFTILCLIINKKHLNKLKKEKKESFIPTIGIEKSSLTPINKKFRTNQLKDKLRLQFQINNYESRNRCCQGYSKPSNPCTFSFNENPPKCCN